MPPEELKAYVGTNQEPLRLVRLGLTRECRVPIEYSKDYYQQHWQERSDIKKLAQLISAEGRLAEARLWSKRVYSLIDRIRMMWQYRTLSPEWAMDDKFIQRAHRTDLLRRQLLLRLAARTYEVEHGKRPSRAEDLVPSVLRAIPKDPETGTNLVLNPAL